MKKKKKRKAEGFHYRSKVSFGMEQIYLVCRHFLKLRILTAQLWKTGKFSVWSV